MQKCVACGLIDNEVRKFHFGQCLEATVAEASVRVDNFVGVVAVVVRSHFGSNDGCALLTVKKCVRVRPTMVLHNMIGSMSEPYTSGKTQKVTVS